MPHVYVSNADSGDISVLHMAPDGSLRLQSTVSVGGNLMPMAIHPNQKVLYAVRRSEPMAVARLAIDPVSRDLQLLDETALPASMAYISTDLAGRFLLAASYPGHQITVSPLAADGTVGPVQQVLATGPYAHAILPSPCQRYVLATALGGGELMVLHFNAESGQLTQAASWAARAGAGPRHFRFDPQGRWVYLLHELDGTVDVLAWDAAQARLSLVQTVGILPPGFTGKPWAADLHLTPDGRHLYTSERTSSTLAHFTVDAASGRLTPQGHTSVETQPRGFAIDPSGRHLLVVGQLSHHLSRWALDPNTGHLDMQQRIAVGQGPNWVEILA
ncbi:beta-propeller fold lactonase family protein [Limnohabitans sp. 2KL-27]|uniref:lactonase family protein n=1 Tax=Limnohabitans sp. 2KL-27 TaxID=1100705 RepID=UPI000B314E4C|nr:beta-propeller fold lactonase family protein [Limnohabitans sp. 2KL-27]